MKIAILGAGAFGTALGGVLADKGYDVDYYDSKVEKEKLSDVLKKAEYIVLAVPSAAAPYLIPYLPTNIPLIIATKGFLDLHNFKKFKDVMALSGPGFAEDIKARHDAYFTTNDERVIDLFKTGYLHFELFPDIIGILMCGALKNVYAMYAGYKGLKPHSLKMQNYLENATFEMANLIHVNGGDGMAVYHACGIGDLMLTCSDRSRNYEYGYKFKRNPYYRPEKTVEGMTTLAKIKRGEIKLFDDMPVLTRIMELFDE